jgi:hypothetical protein
VIKKISHVLWCDMVFIQIVVCFLSPCRGLRYILLDKDHIIPQKWEILYVWALYGFFFSHSSQWNHLLWLVCVRRRYCINCNTLKRVLGPRNCYMNHKMMSEIQGVGKILSNVQVIDLFFKKRETYRSHLYRGKYLELLTTKVRKICLATSYSWFADCEH